jgi:4-hydroxy-tetrahydrodipicolinate reductase
MNIAIIGYGKMGRVIEQQALLRGHEVVLKISSSNVNEFNATNLAKADVAIEFTNPHSAVDNVIKLIDCGIPTVCGTTAWLQELPKVKSLVEQKNGAFIYASNFSLGVNLFFLLNEYAAKLMAPYKDYTAGIKEIHHTAKLDAPSGTAITIAQGLIANNGSYTSWVNNADANAGQLPILSERIDPAPGTHIVTYKSAIDTIELSHEAHSRDGFALGSVIAAEWIVGKKGVFTMRDLFEG